MSIVRTLKGTDEWDKRVEYLEKDILDRLEIWEEGEEGQKDLLHIVFSTRLLYIIRDIIEPCGLDVSWGQLYIKEKRMIGPECDLIIFRGEPEEEWNNHDKPIIRVVLVNPANVCTVIECKNVLKTLHNNPNRLSGQKKLGNKIDNFKEIGLNKKRIWIVAGNIIYKNQSEKQKIRELVINHLGYGKLFYLFDAITEEPNDSGWNSLLDEIVHLR